MASICLVMMVKNEGAVIRRCLESVKGLISHWIICDTGSTDATPQIVQDTLRDIPGALHAVPWVNFGFNRSQALQLARGKADYLLMLDADQVLNIHGEFRHDLQADAYLLRFEGDTDYSLPLLLSSRHEWQYEGVTHECIPYDPAHPWVKLPALSITHCADGGMRADKYERDIRLLTEGIATEPGNARYHFYLAQSYRDSGQLERALEWYEKRLLLSGWEEETWCARYQAARMMHRLGRNWPLVQNHYLAAYQSRPHRLEPLWHVARYYREMNQHHLGFLFARAIVGAPYPDDILFVERTIYEYELPMEYALCCSGTGRHEEAVRVNDLILASGRTPANVIEAATQNRLLSERALSAGFQA